jgi:hypothetical protein
VPRGAAIFLLWRPPADSLPTLVAEMGPSGGCSGRPSFAAVAHNLPSAGSPALPGAFKTPLHVSFFPQIAASLLPLPRLGPLCRRLQRSCPLPRVWALRASLVRLSPSPPSHNKHAGPPAPWRRPPWLPPRPPMPYPHGVVPAGSPSSGTQWPLGGPEGSPCLSRPRRMWGRRPGRRRRATSRTFPPG